MQMINTFRAIKIVAMLLASASTLAQSAFEHQHDHEHRESKAHVHGQANLNLNMQDNSLDIELVVPAMDVLGFEHQPRTDIEKEKIRRVAMLFNDVALWVVPANEALCTLRSNSLVQPYETVPNDSQEKEQNTHGHHAPHSDFTIKAEWHCAKANHLQRIRLNLFNHLPNLQMINVKWIRNGYSGVATLTVKSDKLFLR